MDESLLLSVIDPWGRFERVIGEAAERDKDFVSDILPCSPVPGRCDRPFFPLLQPLAILVITC